MKNMKWKVIKTEHDYDLVSNRLDELLSSELLKGSNDYDEYELLCLLIEDYENKHYKFNEPDPIDYIKFIMDQNGLTQNDMIPYLGSASKVSEVLNRRRNLSLTMIRKLNKSLGIPLDILIKDIDKIDESEVLKTDYTSDDYVNFITESFKNYLKKFAKSYGEIEYCDISNSETLDKIAIEEAKVIYRVDREDWKKAS